MRRASESGWLKSARLMIFDVFMMIIDILTIWKEYGAGLLKAGVRMYLICRFFAHLYRRHRPRAGLILGKGDFA